LRRKPKRNDCVGNQKETIVWETKPKTKTPHPHENVGEVEEAFHG
jgi:hypothetical protein